MRHRRNYANYCMTVKNNHTAIRAFVDSQRLTRIMLCLVNQNGEGGATAHTPFAMLIEDPSKFTALVPPQVVVAAARRSTGRNRNVLAQWQRSKKGLRSSFHGVPKLLPEQVQFQEGGRHIRQQLLAPCKVSLEWRNEGACIRKSQQRLKQSAQLICRRFDFTQRRRAQVSLTGWTAPSLWQTAPAVDLAGEHLHAPTVVGGEHGKTLSLARHGHGQQLADMTPAQRLVLTIPQGKQFLKCRLVIFVGEGDPFVQLGGVDSQFSCTFCP